jgi:hypothetical protein
MSKQAGGVETIGFTREDLKNHLKTQRKQSLKDGEVRRCIDDVFQTGK